MQEIRWVIHLYISGAEEGEVSEVALDDHCWGRAYCQTQVDVMLNNTHSFKSTMVCT